MYISIRELWVVLLFVCTCTLAESPVRYQRSPSSTKDTGLKSDFHGFSHTPQSDFHLGPQRSTRSISELVTPLAVDAPFLSNLYNYLDSFSVLDPLAPSAFASGRHSLSHLSSATDPQIAGSLQYTFSQEYQGIPVWGSFVKVHTANHQHTISHINGVFLQEHQLINASTFKPQISQNEAEAIALKVVVTSPDFLQHTEPRVVLASLVLYHPGLTRNMHADVVMAYQVIVEARFVEGAFNTSKSKYYVFVDAQTGVVVNHFSNRQSALNREVWQTQYKARSPVYTEGSEQPTALDAQNFIKYSGDVYQLFKNMLQRDSYDGKGAKMIGVYNIPANDPTLGCPIQAFWDGTTINFCATMARTDVSVHEWTHAYTEHTHALVYQYQSGALNEAYSDIVAEGLQNIFGIPSIYAVRPDITKCVEISGTGTKRWMVGDELTQFSQFFPEGLRDMYNPNCQGDPRDTQDPNVAIGTADNGGVHTNSGIANQGFSILSDGGTLNGVTVSGIGVPKALAIYLRAMAVYQGPTTNFAGHSIALTKSCNDLEGKKLNDPKTGAESNVVISAGDCKQVENAMSATMMEQPLPTSNTPPLPIIVNGFPSVGPVSTQGSSPTLFVLASPNLVSEMVYCGFSKDGSSIDDTVEGTVLSTESFTSAVCPLPTTWTTPIKDSFVTISADGSTFQTRGALQFFIYADPVITSASPLYIPEQGGIVTITGSGFQEYTGCTLNIVPDSNGGMPDCLTCIFGSFESDHPVAAQFVDANTVTCRVPARSNLTNAYVRAAALLSMNNQVFYPLPDIIFAIDSPIGMGGTVATIIIPLIVAIGLIAIVLLAFHGMSPKFLKPVDEQLRGLIQSDDGSEKGAFMFKFLRGALVGMVLLVLEFVWSVALAASTQTVFSIIVVVITVSAFASVLFGFLVIKNHKNSFLFTAFVLVIVNVVLMLVGFILLCVLISQFRDAAVVSGSNQNAQILLSVAVLILHSINIFLQGLFAKYDFNLSRQAAKGINISVYEDERDLSHVEYSNAP